MQKKSGQQHFQVILALPNSRKKTVSVKASNYKTACARALKRNPLAVGVIDP